MDEAASISHPQGTFLMDEDEMFEHVPNFEYFFPLTTIVLNLG